MQLLIIVANINYYSPVRLRLVLTLQTPGTRDLIILEGLRMRFHILIRFKTPLLW